MLAGSLLLGSLPLIPLGLLESPPQRWSAIEWSSWTIWLYSVVFPVYLAYTWWTAALAARGVAAIAPYALLVPLVGGAIAAVWVGEPLTTWLAAGAALILLGLALGRDWLPRLGREAWARNRRRAIIVCATRAPSCSPATLMRGWVKVALVVGGYVGAALVATAVVAVHVGMTSKDSVGADGMYAFGDSLFFLAAFGLASIPATGAGLFFLRPYPAFWRRFSTAALIIAATALVALIVYAVSQTVSASSTFYAWSAFAILRIIVAPLFALGFFLATLFAPNRSARIALFVATVLEAAAVSGFVFRVLLGALAR